MKKTKLLIMIILTFSSLILISCDFPFENFPGILYPSEELQKFIVKFESCGDIIYDELVEENGKVKRPFDPQREGYTFVGWYKEPECLNEWDFDIEVNSDLILYAKWDEKVVNYTIIFNTNGGSYISNQTIQSNEKLSKPNDPQKEGYTFVGWFIDSKCTNIFDFNSLITADLTLYAKWLQKEYVVKFDLNGGSGYAPDLILNHGETVEIPSDITRYGYKLKGWYIDPQFTIPFVNNGIKNNVTLYAKWVAPLEYGGTNYGSADFNDEDGTYSFTTTLGLWGRISITYNGELLSADPYGKLNITGAFTSENKALWDEKLFCDVEEGELYLDYTTFICSSTKNVIYTFTYDPNTNTLDIQAKFAEEEITIPKNGLFYIIKDNNKVVNTYGSGILDVYGNYSADIKLNRWWSVLVYFNGVQISVDGSIAEITGDIGSYDSRENPKSLYTDIENDGPYSFISSYGDVSDIRIIYTLGANSEKDVLVFDVDAETDPYDSLPKSSFDVDVNQDTELAIWTEEGTLFRDSSMGAIKPWGVLNNGWRTICIVDSEGKIVYFVVNMGNGYGNVTDGEIRYYCHPDYLENNPAYKEENDYWTLTLPERCFAITGYGEKALNFMKILSNKQFENAEVGQVFLNKPYIFSKNVRMTYDAKTSKINIFGCNYGDSVPKTGLFYIYSYDSQGIYTDFPAEKSIVLNNDGTYTFVVELLDSSFVFIYWNGEILDTASTLELISNNNIYVDQNISTNRIYTKEAGKYEFVFTPSTISKKAKVVVNLYVPPVVDDEEEFHPSIPGTGLFFEYSSGAAGTDIVYAEEELIIINDDGTYSFIVELAAWRYVRIYWDGVVLDTASTLELTSIANIFVDDIYSDKLFTNETGQYEFVFTPATENEKAKVIAGPYIPALDEGELAVEKEKDASLAVWTTEGIIFRDSFTNSWGVLNNGWRTVCIVDSEGKIVYFVVNMGNGYGVIGVNGPMYYAHPDYSSFNPAVTITGNAWTLKIPKGCFAVTGHSNESLALIKELTGTEYATSDDAQINVNNMNSIAPNKRISYDEQLKKIKVYLNEDNNPTNPTIPETGLFYEYTYGEEDVNLAYAQKDSIVKNEDGTYTFFVELAACRYVRIYWGGVVLDTASTLELIASEDVYIDGLDATTSHLYVNKPGKFEFVFTPATENEKAKVVVRPYVPPVVDDEIETPEVPSNPNVPSIGLFYEYTYGEEDVNLAYAQEDSIVKNEDGTYTFFVELAAWRYVRLYWNGEILKTNVNLLFESKGNIYTEQAVTDCLYANKDGKYRFIFTPSLNGTLAQVEASLYLINENGEFSVNLNQDTELSVWTETNTLFRDSSIGAIKPWGVLNNGWRTICIVDSEGKIVYFVINIANGYGNVVGENTMYYAHPDYAVLNPAFTLNEDVWTLKIPEGCFAVTAYGEHSLAFIEQLTGVYYRTVDNAQNALNSMNAIDSNVRVSYNESSNTIKVTNSLGE